jgi:hypothetical protein
MSTVVGVADLLERLRQCCVALPDMTDGRTHGVPKRLIAQFDAASER